MFQVNNDHTYTLDQVVGQEVEMVGGSCSCWLIPKDSTGKKWYYHNYACYAPFSLYTDTRRHGLYIGVKMPEPLISHQNGGSWGRASGIIADMVDIEEGYRQWLAWLTTRSPHAEAVVQGQELGYNRFIQMDVDKAGHLVHHTACALRIHQEHEMVPLYWMLFTSMGMEEDLAYLMALMNRVGGNDSRLVAGALVSHAALSSQTVRVLAGFLLRMYQKGLPSWKESSKYGGHGSMWDAKLKGVPDERMLRIDELYPRKQAVKVGGSIFDVPLEAHFNLNKEGVLNFVEHMTNAVTKALLVKPIDKPETNGVKYEKA
jgi:hypothetical protein